MGLRIVGPKKFWALFWSEQILVQKKFGSKKNFTNIMGPKIGLGSKFWALTNFGSEKILGPKKFWDHKN